MFIAVCLVFFAYFYHSYAQTHFHSCADIYKSNILSQSGVYTIYNRQDQAFQVYCDFHKGYGYTYISPATSVGINIDDLYTDATHVLVRDLRTDGTQYEAKIEQITAFKDTPLSIQFNSHTGYRETQNPNMGPYLYLGFVPVAMSRKGHVEGYKLNGQDQVFRNCDGNTNSYFAFHFNQNHTAPSDYHQVSSSMQHYWVDGAAAVPPSKNLPQDFFSFYEVHFGGCGGYGTPQYIPKASGAALGLRYDIHCNSPEDIQHGSKTVSGTIYGSSVTYTCDTGYTRHGGNMDRTCSETGTWTGLAPTCADFPCSSHPCQHGGLCMEVEGTTFTCECTEHFQGQFCEKHV